MGCWYHKHWHNLLYHNAPPKSKTFGTSIFSSVSGNIFTYRNQIIKNNENSISNLFGNEDINWVDLLSVRNVFRPWLLHTPASRPLIASHFWTASPLASICPHSDHCNSLFISFPVPNQIPLWHSHLGRLFKTGM